MTKLIQIKNNKIKFNTNMTSEIFAKTRFSEKIKEKGVIAKLNGKKWEYNPWTFEETEEENRMIILVGTAFEGKVASSLFTEGTKKEIHELAIVLCSALENAINSKAPVENIGAGGIIISNDLKKIIFLPYNFWTTTTMSIGDDFFSTENGIYINQNQDKELAIRWTQAVLVYKAITGFFPFTSLDTRKRSTDIIDGNYSLLKWTIPGINKKITNWTENIFNLRLAEFPVKEFSTYKEKELSEEEITEFRKEAQAAESSKTKLIKSKRFLRAKRTILIATSISIAVVALIIGNLRKTSLEKPTTKGLTSLETVEMYYTALNELNVDAARNCTLNLSTHVDAISNSFLKSRTRSMYDRRSDTVTPAAWLIKNQTRHHIFGLSQFYINKKKGSLLIEGPKKNTNPKAITNENEVQLKDGDKKVFNAEFIILDTTGEDLLTAIKTKEKVEVTYKKDRWVLSSIETIALPKEFKMSEFIDDYLAVMKSNSNEKADVLLACQKLKEKYFFISTEDEIDEGYEYLKKISVFNVK